MTDGSSLSRDILQHTQIFRSRFSSAAAAFLFLFLFVVVLLFYSFNDESRLANRVREIKSRKIAPARTFFCVMYFARIFLHVVSILCYT